MNDKTSRDDKNIDYSVENYFPKDKYPSKIQGLIPEENQYPKPEQRRHTLEELTKKYCGKKNVGKDRK